MPPIISNISASGITTSGATISWTTNVLSTTTIEYGTDTSYGSTVNDTNSTTGDSVTLSNLSANTTYDFAIIAYANGTSTTSGNNTFTTSAASSGGSGGGGGGGGGGFVFPSPTSTPVSSGGTSGAALLNLVEEIRSLSLQMFLTANNGTTLTVGSDGQDVWAIQVFLITNNILSPTGPAGSKLVNPTSYFGTLTQGALAAYQAQVGVSPTSGILGPRTHAYLEALGGGTTPVTPPAIPPTQPAANPSPTLSLNLSLGDTGSGVTTLQTILVTDGYLSSGTFAQGTFDPATLRAVETFQCARGIACSDATYGYGFVGAKTRAALAL
jgi:peptidoglycan hydrolase-like protein with peptidoglycan-binding domain